ncbi:hypothetical protein RND71_009817 [Anisodus tanguticus]|uniref:Uncharacterized protein n=1 Tax=Anisodus tanguticus TaxID=243964 RepID=A0AAE1VII9_9SOLA|nr:hypothetical protein RND71_009817 [Anisodus tanguticus]
MRQQYYLCRVLSTKQRNGCYRYIDFLIHAFIYIERTTSSYGREWLVEVVKVSPSDELDSFETGQPLPSVQSLQDGGEPTKIDSLRQQSNSQNGENSVATALLVPSCSSNKRDSLNCERPVQVDV